MSGGANNDKAFNSAENSDEYSYNSDTPPKGQTMQRDVEKSDEAQKKKRSKIFLAVWCLWLAFIFIAWPIVEYVFYSKTNQLCSKTMPGPVDFAKWLLADAIILSIPVAFVALSCFCMICVGCFDLICSCKNVEMCGQILNEVVESRPYNIALYSIVFIIALVVGILGIFTVQWALAHCSAPLPGIAIFITSFRFLGVVVSLWILKKTLLGPK